MFSHSRNWAGFAKVLFIALLIAQALGTVACSSNDNEVPGTADSVADGDGQAGTDTGTDTGTEDGTGEEDTADTGTSPNTDVEPGHAAPLSVILDFQGSGTFDSVNVYLFSQENGQPACAGFDANSLPFPAVKSASVSSMVQTVEFPTFAGLSAETPIMHFTAVALATSSDDPLALAYGCLDHQVSVELGKSNVVTIVLKDVPPKYAGIYEVVGHFDMISALPDNIEIYINILLDFFNSPTAGLLRLTCMLESGALESLCSTIFVNPEDPSIESLTSAGSIIAQVMDAIVYALIADNVGADIIFTGQDVGNILRDLEIHGTMTLSAEPDSTGFLSDSHTEHVWETVSYQWTFGETCNPAEPDCGLTSLSLSSTGQNEIFGHFDMLLDGYANGAFDQMVIYPHSLDFRYGAFINFVIEKMVLPQIAGDGSDGLPVVDSYEKFIKVLLGGKECLVTDNCCEVFAQTIVDQTGPALQDTLTAGCQALVELGTDYFRSSLLSLDATTGDSLTLSTPEGVPCTLYDMNNDRIIDALGKAEPEAQRCKWRAVFNLAGTPMAIDAEFWGTRVQ